MKNLNKAIIPVAGLGFVGYFLQQRQFQNSLPILDKPIIEYIVEEISLSGVKEVIFVQEAEKSRSRIILLKI